MWFDTHGTQGQNNLYSPATLAREVKMAFTKIILIRGRYESMGDCVLTFWKIKKLFFLCNFCSENSRLFKIKDVFLSLINWDVGKTSLCYQSSHFRVVLPSLQLLNVSAPLMACRTSTNNVLDWLPTIQHAYFVRGQKNCPFFGQFCKCSSHWAHKVWGAAKLHPAPSVTLAQLHPVLGV